MLQIRGCSECSPFSFAIGVSGINLWHPSLGAGFLMTFSGDLRCATTSGYHL